MTEHSPAPGSAASGSAASGSASPNSAAPDSPHPTRQPRVSGAGRLLIVVYGILALAATGRSVFQIIDRFSDAPVAYSLSALAAVVYIVATIALIVQGRTWYRVAVSTITFELAGVLIVGSISLFAPAVLGLGGGDPFGPDSTVWSVYGAGYVFIPLVLPILGLTWLTRRRRRAVHA